MAYKHQLNLGPWSKKKKYSSLSMFDIHLNLDILNSTDVGDATIHISNTYSLVTEELPL